MENQRGEKEFAAFARLQLDALLVKLEEKGRQYGSDSDALQNFEECSTFLAVTPEFYLMTQATKHWHAIVSWASGRSRSMAELQERVMDIIIYMLLLLFMLNVRKGDK